MSRYQLVKKESLSPSARASALPVAFDDVNLDLLVEMLLPQSPLRSRTQLRLQLEDEMAAAMETAMRGERAAFLDIYEYVPGAVQPGGVYAVTRKPGPLLREIEASHCFVPVDESELTPEIMLVRDETTGTVNELVTPGGVLQVEGSQFAAVGGNATGEWVLIDAMDHRKWTLDIVEPRKGTLPPSSLDVVCVMVPESLEDGTYVLEYRRSSGHQRRAVARLLNELRVAR